MNVALWIVQCVLALLMLPSGTMKVVSRREMLVTKPGLAWAGDFTDAQLKLIGIAEVAGAIGIVAPWAMQVVPILTPVAAACLALRLLGAARIHRSRKEPWVPALVLAALCVFVVGGRLL